MVMLKLKLKRLYLIICKGINLSNITNKQIHLFKPYFRVDECLNEIKECLEKGWTGLGFKTVQFEESWKKYTGLNNAHFLNSATVGLDLAFEILTGRSHGADFRQN